MTHVGADASSARRSASSAEKVAPATCWLLRGRVGRRLALRSLLQKRIAFPLLANRRLWTVPWNHHRLIGQRQHLTVQRPHDLLERSARQVCSSDTSRKQRIARNQLLFCGKK